MKLIVYCCLLIGFTLYEAEIQSAEPNNIKILGSKKIWSGEPHSAFTDLERFQNKWYCAFRVGKGHAGKGDYGKIRIIVSDDGQSWRSAALLQNAGVDLRDAKLSITPRGELLLNSCEYRVDNDRDDIRNNTSVVYRSKNGTDWSKAKSIAHKGFWLWQTSWVGEQGFALGYQWGSRDATRFYRTVDGDKYEIHVDHIRPPGDRSNEHAMVFDPNGIAHMLLRRDNTDSKTGGYALLGKAEPPYKDWEWRRLNITLGGPSMIRLPDGRLLACVRRYANENHRNWGSQWTELGWVDATTATYTPAAKLPSGGDSSYAGLVFYNDLLWVSYYSSHEGNTSIYLAKIQIDDLK